MWISSVQVGPCDSAVGADRATEAIQSSLDLFKLFVGSGRGARIGHAYRAGFPRFSSTLYSDSSGFHITQRWASGNAVVKDDWIGDVADFRPWIFGEEAISERLQSWERLTDPEQDFWML